MNMNTVRVKKGEVMKIGFLRMNMVNELDPRTSSGTGIEDRISIIAGLARCGHKWIFYSTVRQDDIEKYPNYEYDFRPKKIKCDVLMIEVGTTNMMFIDKVTKEPHIRHMMNILNKFKGVVIWIQTDPLLPIPFYQLGFTKYQWGDKNNGYCGGPRGKGWTVDSGWGTEKELMDGKKHKVFIKSNKFKLVRSLMNGSRYKYLDLKSKFDLVLFPPEIIGMIHMPKNSRKKMKKIFDKKVRNGIIYPGGDRSRIRAFKRIYGDIRKKYPVSVYGRWSEERKEQFKDFKFHDWVGYHTIKKVIMNHLLCVQIGTEVANKTNWTTVRLNESIMDGTVCLCDRPLYRMGKKIYIPEKFVVDNSKDVMRWFKILSKDFDTYYKIWREQYDYVSENCMFENFKMGRYMDKKIRSWV